MNEEELKNSEAKPAEETAEENSTGTAEAEAAAPAVPLDKHGKPKKSVKREIIEWIVTLVAAVAIALVIRTLLFEPVRVDGHSMDDTLADGEVMLVTKPEYLLGDPERFDVVICHYPDRGSTNFVKRVIGLPGDTIQLLNGDLYVNGELVEEAYINEEYKSGYLNSFLPYTVPKKGDTYVDANGETQTYT